jgi:hypothetical protein
VLSGINSWVCQPEQVFSCFFLQATSVDSYQNFRLEQVQERTITSKVPRCACSQLNCRANRSSAGLEQVVTALSEMSGSSDNGLLLACYRARPCIIVVVVQSALDILQIIYYSVLNLSCRSVGIISRALLLKGPRRGCVVSCRFRMEGIITLRKQRSILRNNPTLAVPVLVAANADLKH